MICISICELKKACILRASTTGTTQNGTIGLGKADSQVTTRIWNLISCQNWRHADKNNATNNHYGSRSVDGFWGKLRCSPSGEYDRKLAYKIIAEIWWNGQIDHLRSNSAMLSTWVWLYCTSSENKKANALKLTCSKINGETLRTEQPKHKTPN